MNKSLSLPFIAVCLLLTINSCKGPKPVSVKAVDPIEAIIATAGLEADIRFLASDELAGRDTGSAGLNKAAEFLRTRLQTLGVKSPEKADNFYQTINFSRAIGQPQGLIDFGGMQWPIDPEEVLVMAGQASTLQAPVVFIDYGNVEQLIGLDVKGKIVIALSGFSGADGARQRVGALAEKRQMLSDKGALLLVESYATTSTPFKVMQRFVNRPGLRVVSNGVPVIWVNDTDARLAEAAAKAQGAEEATKMTVRIDSTPEGSGLIPSQNVLGIIEGTDELLKNEYILLGAHYDHVGIRAAKAGDSIYNGARDNAIGTVAVLQAAGALMKKRPKRSVIIAFWTAEEIGLVGSNYYANNPLIPLDQTMYNLNIDGAGYNDTTSVTIIGLGRTTADSMLVKASSKYGLVVKDDPVPEQGLFDRSDNVSFAAKGIPAPDFSPGMTAFDAELMKYYHQPADEANSLDYAYLTKYMRAYALSAYLIANADEAPFWIAGDKYEEAGKKLYRRN